MKQDIIKVATFRERLCELCNRSGLSDAELSRNLRVSKQTLSAWRLGVRSPKEPTIVYIANYFGVSLEWIMGFNVPLDYKSPEPKSVVLTDQELVIIKKYRSLSEPKRKAIDLLISDEKEIAPAVRRED